MRFHFCPCIILSSCIMSNCRNFNEDYDDWFIYIIMNCWFENRETSICWTKMDCQSLTFLTIGREKTDYTVSVLQERDSMELLWMLKIFPMTLQKTFRNYKFSKKKLFHDDFTNVPHARCSYGLKVVCLLNWAFVSHSRTLTILHDIV